MPSCAKRCIMVCMKCKGELAIMSYLFVKGKEIMGIGKVDCQVSGRKPAAVRLTE